MGNLSEQSPRVRQYVVRLTQSHEPFRRPELESIATELGIKISLDYSSTSPFCILTLPPGTLQNSDNLARRFIQHSILGKSIHELYSSGPDYDALHDGAKQLPDTVWESYESATFKFSMDVYCGKRSETEQRDLVERFVYLPLRGKVRLKKPDVVFTLLEEWTPLTPEEHSALATVELNLKPSIDPETEAIVERLRQRKPKRVFFGRHVGDSRRELITKHDLKKRPYISTTSMDAELALVTANIARAAPGKLFLDPFTGTGGFMVAASELGAVTLGTDIDGRSYRGKGRGVEKGVGANFTRYKISDRFGDCLTSDLTNSPLRKHQWLDGIVCDPPYGVREGLKVLGRRVIESKLENGEAPIEHKDAYYIDGVASHTLPGFVAPKRPYSFDAMLDDILDFAARTLVDGGRIAFWMPCANTENVRLASWMPCADDDAVFPIPRHDMLELKYNCVQSFNKWSRRLLVYERLPGPMPDTMANKATNGTGHSADSLNQFRRLYFQGFNAKSEA